MRTSARQAGLHLAREKGVGALVPPAKSDQGPRPAPPTLTLPEPPAAPFKGATPRRRMKTLNVELPDYVWTELKIRAAHKQTSVRHVIMTVLRADGITISERDMVEDGRRLRNGARDGSDQ